MAFKALMAPFLNGLCGIFALDGVLPVIVCCQMINNVLGIQACLAHVNSRPVSRLVLFVVV